MRAQAQAALVDENDPSPLVNGLLLAVTQEASGS